MSLTVMLGGTAHPELIDRSDDELCETIEKEMRSILGMTGSIADLTVYRHKHAIPLYSPDLIEKWNQAKEGWCSRPGRLLFGNYTGHL